MNETQAFYRLAYNKEGSDCSVRALAVACACPYDTAHAAMHFAGRGPHQAANMYMMHVAAGSLGFELCPTIVKGKTLRTLCRSMVGTEGAYIAETSWHVVGFWKGECIDWSRDTLQRVVKVYAVIKRTEQ